MLSLMFSYSSCAQIEEVRVEVPETVGVSSDSLDKMKAHFHKLVDERQIAGIQTGVIRKGKLIHFDSYGYSNLETKKLLEDKSIFRLFSMTKPIVSVALMQLYDEGKFSLEDPLYKYLPMFETMYVQTGTEKELAKHPIKVIDLLRHTSGFGYGRGDNQELNEAYGKANLWQAATNEEFAEKLSKLPLYFEPGTDWHYGVSTGICGYLIEVLSGKSLDVYLKEHILDPLGMHDTHFQLTKDKVDRFTVSYRWNGEQLVVSKQPETSRFVEEVTLFNGGGGLVSTTIDYLKFCEMLLNDGRHYDKQILKTETLNSMFADHLAETRKHKKRLRLPPGEASFGLGFAIKGDNPKKLKEVYGWGGAMGTYFKVDTKSDLAYVLMIQLSPYRQLGLRQLVQDYVNASIIK